MQRLACLLGFVHYPAEHFIFVQIAILNRLVNACQALVDNATGTDIQMTYLRIADLACRQTDSLAAGFQGCMRIICKITVQVRCFCHRRSVGFICGSNAPTIKNH